MLIKSPTQEILQYFRSRNFEKSRQFSYEYSPQAVRKALSELSRPQDAYNTIHVAGTVAKGSSVKLLSEMLRKEGFCVGSFYSPHLLRLNERIQVNHQEISNKELAHFWEFVKKNLNVESLSFFDCITIIAFLYFQDKKVDWAIIETGLGGRKDSTNNLKAQFSVITPIDLDHQNILGDTLEQIAFEKAGIIHSQPIFSYPQHREVGNILIKESKKKSLLKFYPDDKSYPQGNYFKKNLNVCLWIYQEYFKKTPPEISFNLQGRLEVLSEKPRVVFDSAHNKVAIKELSFWLSSQKSDLKWILYLNTLRNKNLEKMLETLLLYAEKKIEKIYFIDFLTEKNRFYQFKDLSHETQVNLNPIKIKQEFHRLLTNEKYAHLICGSMYLYEQIGGLSKK